MTREEHQNHHVLLHEYLDEIVADYMSNSTALPSKNTILDLMIWSNQQAAQIEHHKGEN